MTKYGFAINLHRCVGCRTCTVSCKMENHVADGNARMRVLNGDGTIYANEDRPTGTYPDLSFDFRPVPCQHCDSPSCVQVCPTGASMKRDDGIVVVKESICIGCGACMHACPYGARYIDPDTATADKCTLCAHRLDGGIDTTMCQLCCPNRAIVVGDLDDPESEISKLLAEHEAQRYLDDKGTEPNAFYWRSVTLPR